MMSVLKTPSTVVWLLLVLATATSWFLGTDHGLPPSDQSFLGAVILVVAVVKVRLVGTYFMELRHAPAVLRSLFNLYCLVLLGVLLGLYLW
jgi:hypothetical protein